MISYVEFSKAGFEPSVVPYVRGMYFDLPSLFVHDYTIMEMLSGKWDLCSHTFSIPLRGLPQHVSPNLLELDPQDFIHDFGWLTFSEVNYLLLMNGLKDYKSEDVDWKVVYSVMSTISEHYNDDKKVRLIFGFTF
jgi:hypothetical protein